jgi:hypothetical protein
MLEEVRGNGFISIVKIVDSYTSLMILLIASNLEISVKTVTKNKFIRLI